jgi:hypothetical protein
MYIDDKKLGDCRAFKSDGRAVVALMRKESMNYAEVYTFRL